jgi:signal transduction histidine kinase
VHELAIGLHAPANLQPALDVALDVAIQLHRARHGVLFLYTDDALRISTARGFDGVPEELLAKLARDLDRHAGQRYIIADTEQDERYAELVEMSRWVGIRAAHRTPIRTRSGRLLGVLIVHLETPRAPTDLEMQLTDLCVRYAADAIERTHADAEIRRAKEAAEQANRAKDEFLAVLGHELRNPLAPIASAVHLLDVRATDERARAARSVIERQLGHLTRLVDDLLDISRIRQGRLELQRAPLEVHEVIARAVEMTAAMFAERRHTVVVDAAPGLRMHGDATRLAQVISNLLVNAAKYSDPGKTTTITATRIGPSVEIAVADQGVGLAPEMLPRVFELFAQEERSLDRAQGGLGLGLAIVRKLVVLHGGSVRAHSDGVGRGSTFTVSLPALDSAEPREPAPPRRRAARRSERPRRILVVDDNVDVADMMAELLEEMGHVVRTANDGETALAVVPQFAPEVALLDLGLPVMDGLELARKLRAAPGCPFLVAVTGYGRGSDQERAREAGFDAHLVKPVSVETVLRVIDGAPSA